VGDETDPGPIGGHTLGIYGRARLKTFRLRRGTAEWRSGRLRAPVRADPLVVYGFSPDEQAEVLYAERALLELESGPSRLRLPTQRGKIETPRPV
jgi:hypothetical protein